MTILNNTENKFQLLIGGSWEEWEVIQTWMRKGSITRYTVKRLADETEHNLLFDKVAELYEQKKLKLS